MKGDCVIHKNYAFVNMIDDNNENVDPTINIKSNPTTNYPFNDIEVVQGDQDKINISEVKDNFIIDSHEIPELTTESKVIIPEASNLAPANHTTITTNQTNSSASLDSLLHKIELQNLEAEQDTSSELEGEMAPINTDDSNSEITLDDNSSSTNGIDSILKTNPFATNIVTTPNDVTPEEPVEETVEEPTVAEVTEVPEESDVPDVSEEPEATIEPETSEKNETIEEPEEETQEPVVETTEPTPEITSTYQSNFVINDESQIKKPEPEVAEDSIANSTPLETLDNSVSSDLLFEENTSDDASEEIELNVEEESIPAPKINVVPEIEPLQEIDTTPEPETTPNFETIETSAPVSETHTTPNIKTTIPVSETTSAPIEETIAPPQVTVSDTPVQTETTPRPEESGLATSYDENSIDYLLNNLKDIVKSQNSSTDQNSDSNN